MSAARATAVRLPFVLLHGLSDSRRWLLAVLPHPPPSGVGRVAVLPIETTLFRPHRLKGGDLQTQNREEHP